jgi:hypothetical protein
MVVPVSAPLLSYTPDSLDFGYFNTQDSFEVWNSGDDSLIYSFLENYAWIIGVNPVNGISTGEHDIIIVTINRSGFSPGTYNGSISISSNGGSENIGVTMGVPEPAPILAFSPDSLNFDSLTVEMSFEIWNSGGGTLNYNLLNSYAWITSVSPLNGSSTGEHDIISVRVSRSGLSPGTYEGNIIISSNGGYDLVSVTMIVP